MRAVPPEPRIASKNTSLWMVSVPGLAYINASPTFFADQVNEPILLIHGAVDNNSGTFPMQSERLYGALKGLGGTVRLVMLPHESHGYRARESILHMLWEMSEWLDRWVRDAEPRSTETAR